MKIGFNVKAQVMKDFCGGFGIHYDVKFVTKKDGKEIPLYLYNFYENAVQMGFEWQSEDMDFQNEFSEYRMGLRAVIDDRKMYKHNKDAYKILCRWAKEIDEDDSNIYDEANKFYEDYVDDLDLDMYIMNDLRECYVDDKMFEALFEMYNLLETIEFSGEYEHEPYCEVYWYDIINGSKIYDWHFEMRLWNEVA